MLVFQYLTLPRFVQGYTALHYAAANDKIDVIHELMEHGADVNASDKNVLMHCAPQNEG